MDKKALDNIAKKIRADADRKVREYERMAEEKKAEILTRSEAELEKELKALRTRKEREIENHVNFTISQAKISGKRAILNEREEGMESVFREVLSDAPTRDPEGYRNYLQRSILHMKEVLGEGTVICRPEDESTIRGMLPPGWDTEASLAVPGIIGRSRDGSMEVDFTVERRLEDMKEDLRKSVSEILYGGGQ